MTKIVDWFFTYKSTQILNQKSDQELKSVLQEGFDELAPIFLEKHQAKLLLEGEKLSGAKLPPQLRNMPDIQKLLELELDEL